MCNEGRLTLARDTLYYAIALEMKRVSTEASGIQQNHEVFLQIGFDLTSLARGNRRSGTKSSYPEEEEGSNYGFPRGFEKRNSLHKTLITVNTREDVCNRARVVKGLQDQCECSQNVDSWKETCREECECDGILWNFSG